LNWLVSIPLPSNSELGIAKLMGKVPDGSFPCLFQRGMVRRGPQRSKGKFESPSAFAIPSGAILITWSHPGDITWDLFQNRLLLVRELVTSQTPPQI
jgi:hypothetical protein